VPCPVLFETPVFEPRAVRVAALRLPSGSALTPPQRHADRRTVWAVCRGCVHPYQHTRRIALRAREPNTPFAILTRCEDTMTAQATVVSLPAEQTLVAVFGLLRLAVHARDSIAEPPPDSVVESSNTRAR